MFFHRFHTRTWLALLASSIVLAGGVYLFIRGQAAQRAATELATSVKKARTQVDTLEASSKDYAELIRRISWRPGIELRRESVDMSATFAGNELDRVNEMFAASYSGKGYFSLTSFKMEDVTGSSSGSQGGAPFTIRVSLKGDNTLVLEPR